MRCLPGADRQLGCLRTQAAVLRPALPANRQLQEPTLRTP